MLLARWLLCMKGVSWRVAQLGATVVSSCPPDFQADAGSAVAAGRCVDSLAWAWAAVPVPHPRGETCSSDSWTTASHLPFGFALVAGSAGLLVGETSPLARRRESGFIQTHLPSAVECWDCRGSSGGGSQFTVGVLGSRPSTRPCLPAFPELSYPARFRWLIDSWQLRGTVAWLSGCREGSWVP